MSTEDKIDFIVNSISRYLTYKGPDLEMLNYLKNKIKKEISLEGKLQIIDRLLNLEELKRYKTKNEDLFVYAPGGIAICDTRPKHREVIINIGAYKPEGKKFSEDKFDDIYKLVKNKAYKIIFLNFGSLEDNPAILVFDRNNLRLLGFSGSASLYFISKEDGK